MRVDDTTYTGGNGHRGRSEANSRGNFEFVLRGGKLLLLLSSRLKELVYSMFSSAAVTKSNAAN